MTGIEDNQGERSELGDDLPGLLAWLVGWVARQFDGDWEHGHGFTLGLIDNPGWRLDVDVSNFDLPGTELLPIKESDSDHTRFFFAQVTTDDMFEGTCDASQLERLLRVFRSLIETSPAWPRED